MVFSQLAVSALRPTATSFKPGAIQHVIKRIMWHPQGITACRRFAVVQEEALTRGRKTSFAKGLHKTHGTEDPKNPRNSKIRDADPQGAAPFEIPPCPDGIPVAEILEEGADTSNMVQCTAVKLETVGQECAVNLPKADKQKLVRQKSYTKRNVSDGCAPLVANGLGVVEKPLVRHDSDKFLTWSVDDYLSWISESESAPPGVTVSNVHLGRINTIKGVPVSWNTEAVDLRTSPHSPITPHTPRPRSKRTNYCDN